MKEFKLALKYTFPIFFTYIFIGIAYGIMMKSAGYGILLSFISAVFVYAGSMQIIMIPMMVSGASLWSLAIMTIFVNARHLFYGIGFIEKFKKLGWRKPYMILALTDETYSVLCSLQIEEGTDEKKTMFLIALLNHTYWILGCTIGSGMNSFIKFDMKGIDFSATAFFLVVVINQWKQHKSKLPFTIAILSSILFIVALGSDYFLIPALTSCIVLLLVFENKIIERESPTYEHK